MILRSSTGVIVDDTNTSQTGESVLEMNHKELGLPSNCVDLKKFSCLNKDVVSFENVSANIENSNDVIIGPVTQFNVNGNVTFVRGGSAEDTDRDDQEKENSSRLPYEAGSSRNYRISRWFYSILLLLNFHWTIVRNSLIAGILIFVVVVITLVILHKDSPEEIIYDTAFKDPYYNESVGTHAVIYRKQWGGLPPRSSPTRLQLPVDLIIVSCDFKDFCNTSDTCASAVRAIQKLHQSLKHFVDVGYNFMIGGDGNIYVGTGWDYRNFHRKPSIGINFLGNYIFDQLTEDMVDSFNKLVEQGLQLKKLSKDYKLVGENQTNSRAYLSPGPNVYKWMKHWPQFYNDTWF